MKYTILITCAGGSLKSHEGFFLKNFSKYKKNIFLVGLDLKPHKIKKNIFQARIKSPSPKKIIPYKKFMFSSIKKYQVNLVIPGSDEEAYVLSLYKKEFEKLGCVVLVNSFVTVKILSNKILTYKALNKDKKLLPTWNEIYSKKELINYLGNYINKFGSAVVKPSNSRGGRDVFIIKKKKIKKKYLKNSRVLKISYEDFKKKIIRKLKEKFPLIITEELFGPVYDLDIISKKSKLIASVFRKRIIPSDPNSGHEIIYNKKIVNLAKKVSKLLKINYLIDCDLMQDRNKKFKVLEVNPRPSGSFAISNVAGFNIYDVLLDILFNKKLNIKKIHNKRISKSFLNNYIIK